jgi:hypothetical protein
MRHLPAAALALAVALAVPAAAGEQRTRIVDRAWTVQLDGGPREHVEPGATYRHCDGHHVVYMAFRGRMVHPSRKGTDYDWKRRHNGEYEGEGNLGTGENGRLEVSFVHESPFGDSGFGDGKWTLRVFRSKAIGKTSIYFKTVTGPAC